MEEVICSRDRIGQDLLGIYGGQTNWHTLTEDDVNVIMLQPHLASHTNDHLEMMRCPNHLYCHRLCIVLLSEKLSEIQEAQSSQIWKAIQSMHNSLIQTANPNESDYDFLCAQRTYNSITFEFEQSVEVWRTCIPVLRRVAESNKQVSDAQKYLEHVQTWFSHNPRMRVDADIDLLSRAVGIKRTITDLLIVDESSSSLSLKNIAEFHITFSVCLRTLVEARRIKEGDQGLKNSLESLTESVKSSDLALVLMQRVSQDPNEIDLLSFHIQSFFNEKMYAQSLCQQDDMELKCQGNAALQATFQKGMSIIRNNDLSVNIVNLLPSLMDLYDQQQEKDIKAKEDIGNQLLQVAGSSKGVARRRLRAILDYYRHFLIRTSHKSNWQKKFFHVLQLIQKNFKDGFDEFPHPIPRVEFLNDAMFLFDELAGFAIAHGYLYIATHLLESGRNLLWSILQQERNVNLGRHSEELTSALMKYDENTTSKFFVELQLQDLPNHGICVIVNASSLRCDAIILLRRGIELVPLPLVDDAEFQQWTEKYLLITSALENPTKKARTDLNTFLLDFHQFASNKILKELEKSKTWNAIIQPSLENHTCTKDISKVPTVWWSPIGQLALLPFHILSYKLGKSRLRRSISRRSTEIPFISAYAPSLNKVGTFLHQSLSNAVVIGNYDDQRRKLKNGEQEFKIVSKALHTLRTTSLRGKSCTLSEVQRGLQQPNTWIHYIGHSVQQIKKPLQSCLILNNDSLTISVLSRFECLGGGAFLNSCQTFLGSEIVPGEHIRLADALLHIGKKTILTSIWDANDQFALRFASIFYKHFPHSNSPTVALIKTIKEVQKRQFGIIQTPYWLWMNYTLVGST